MVNAGSVVATFSADIRDFQTKLKTVQSGLSSVSGGLQSVAGVAQAFTNKVNLGITALGTAIGGLGTYFLKSAADTQMLRSDFNVLLGDVEKGAEMFKKLQTMASITPFTTDQLAQSTKMLLSMGISAEQATQDLQMLGDVSLGNSNKLNGLSYAFSQVMSTGRLMGQDLMQMINQGFNPLQIISQKTGKSMVELKKEMENGAISAEMVRDAFKTATSEGGLFYKGMEKGSLTLQGRLSTLKDNVMILGREIVGLSETGDVIQGGLFDKLGQAVNFLVQIIDQNKESIKGFFLEIGNILNNTANYIMSYKDQFMALWNWVIANQEVVTKAITSIGLALTTLYVIGTIANMVSLLTNPLTLIIVVLSALFFAWQTNFLGIQDITKSVVDTITTFWNDYKDDFKVITDAIWAIIQYFVGVAQQLWTDYGESIVMIAKGAWTIISSTIEFWFKVIVGYIKFFTAIFKGDWQGAWDAVKEIGDAGQKHIANLFNGLESIISGALKAVWQSLTGWLGKMWDSVKETAEKIHKKLTWGFSVDSKGSPSIRERLIQMNNVISDQLSQIEIPNFHADLSDRLAPLMPTNNKTINQNVNVAVANPIDIDTLSSLLAYGSRKI